MLLHEVHRHCGRALPLRRVIRGAAPPGQVHRTAARALEGIGAKTVVISDRDEVGPEVLVLRGRLVEFRAEEAPLELRLSTEYWGHAAPFEPTGPDARLAHGLI